ncbi:MAG: hypothetical protein AB1461_13050 [Thermodesulfobacteriota bacterium]
MKTKLLLLLALLSLALMPVSALAETHEHSGHEHSGHEMAMEHGQMIMLGAQEVDGFKAEARLKDSREAMAKAGMQYTHHFMIVLQEAATGKTVTTGTVALKIKGPDKVDSAAIPLMGMEGHFGADITLAAAGPYEFTVGTRLPDGKTRQFQFSHQLK